MPGARGVPEDMLGKPPGLPCAKLISIPISA